MNKINAAIKEAIETSIEFNMPVSIELPADQAADMIKTAAAEYDVGFAEAAPDKLDAWGYTEDTPDNEMDWRLSVTLIKKSP